MTKAPYETYIENAVASLKDAGDYRVFRDIERKAGEFPLAYDHKTGRDIVIWCSNDYLGMGQHNDVLNAFIESAEAMGAGSGGTRNIAGTHHPMVQLEEELADLHGKDAALVFTSGYVANSTVLATLGQKLPNVIYFSDASNHASMIEGIRFSRAEKHIFKHNDIDHLESLLQSAPKDSTKIIAFESVYSMDGDFGKIREIVALAKKYEAISYMDEVHAVGLYGKSGAGVGEQEGLMSEITIIQGTLGKAFGVIGGYIASNAMMVDFLRSFAPGFIFSTSLPPAIAEAALASIRHVRANNLLRKQFHARVEKLKRMLKEEGIKTLPSETHIIPIVVGEPNMCREISSELLSEYGIYVQPINYPTVPHGTERLRITPSPHHTDEMMNDLVNAIKAIFSKYDLIDKAKTEKHTTAHYAA